MDDSNANPNAAPSCSPIEQSDCCPHGNHMRSRYPDNLVPFAEPEDPQTSRQLKAMTAATVLWVVVLIGAAAVFLFAVPWAVKGIFGWFGVY